MNASCDNSIIIKKKDLKNNYYSFVLNSFKKAGNSKPGMFVHLQVPDSSIFLRRAFSIASVDKKKQELEIIIKVFGRGTKIMANLKQGDTLNILGPLGTPFALPKKNKKILLVAGGVGFPPLLYLANEMIEKGYDPKKMFFFYGGRSKDDLIELSRIKKTKANFIPATENGSMGSKGLITKIVEEMIQSSDKTDDMYIYSCGPEGMLKAVDKLGQKYNIKGQLSLEAPMPCGVGICLGCVVPLAKGGYARVCCDGPVFEIGEVVL